ncbi:MAG: hypothetical protein ACI4NE_05025 [Succinivibrio sp.]
MEFLCLFKSMIRCCFTFRDNRSELNKKKFSASLNHMEYVLDKEQELGYQRHFITVGCKMRHASEVLSNANC